MTLLLIDILAPSVVTFLSRYFVPMTPHQCIPETAPARTTPDASVFHHEFAQACLNTKNAANATLLAATAMIAEPTTYATLYSVP